MKKIFLIVLLQLLSTIPTNACSILYYIDTKTGKIYAVNNEDYWYDVKPYIQIMPRDEENLARLWYGWDDFAQGGINESGLFFDGATTPEQNKIEGYSSPNGNLGDDILASCSTVAQALDYLEKNKIALTNGHILVGDRMGNAAVVEWVRGERKVIPMKDNRLMVTNFLLSDTTQGNYPCPRYNAMENDIARIRHANDTIGLKTIGNIVAKAVQPKTKNEEGREGGTLYSTFINITDMEFILIYKLDNTKITKLNLLSEFANKDERKIKLE